MLICMNNLKPVDLDLAAALADVSPWVFLTIGVAVVFADLFLTNTFFMAWIGMAIASLGIMSWCGLSGDVMVYSFPPLVLGWALIARPLMIKASHGRSSQRKNARSLVGCTGHVLSVHDEQPSQGRMRVPGQGEWSIRMEKGLPLEEGAEVCVIEREGLTLIVTASLTSADEK